MLRGLVIKARDYFPGFFENAREVSAYINNPGLSRVFCWGLGLDIPGAGDRFPGPGAGFPGAGIDSRGWCFKGWGLIGPGLIPGPRNPPRGFLTRGENVNRGHF